MSADTSSATVRPDWVEEAVGALADALSRAVAGGPADR